MIACYQKNVSQFCETFLFTETKQVYGSDEVMILKVTIYYTGNLQIIMA